MARRTVHLLHEDNDISGLGESGLSGKSLPKVRFSARMPNGDFLSLAVWPGKTDPTAEVLTVQVRHASDTGWQTLGRLAVYRTVDGRYSQLPERVQAQNREFTGRDLGP